MEGTSGGEIKKNTELCTEFTEAVDVNRSIDYCSCLLTFRNHIYFQFEKKKKKINKIPIEQTVIDIALYDIHFWIKFLVEIFLDTLL